MGVSWFLMCKKCEHVVQQLHDLGVVDEPEELIKSRFYFYEYDNIDVKKLKTWLDAHSSHGEIKYSGD